MLVSVVVSTLDALLSAEIITPLQYLERMPENIIPNKTGLISEFKERDAAAAEYEKGTSDEAILKQWEVQQPELYAKYQQLPPEQQQMLLQKARQRLGAGASQTPPPAV